MKNRKEAHIETQAEMLIRTFGGVPKLAAALRVRPTTLYRWKYPSTRGGTDGLVPCQYWPHILAAADNIGITLSYDHFLPIFLPSAMKALKK